MAAPWTERSTGGLLGLDPGRTIRIWVTLLLRIGIGLSLLSTGLAGYFGLRAGGNGWRLYGPGASMAMLDPVMSSLPYVAIGLGLALILGFLTTASAIGAGFFGLILPVFAIIQIAAGGQSNGFMGGRGGGDEFLTMMMSMSLPNLLTNAAMIWLSPIENNPYSVDALIFGRNEMEPDAPAPATLPAPESQVETVVDEPIRIGE